MRTDRRVLLLLCTLAAARLGAAERGVLLAEVPVLDAAGEEIALYRESHALLIGVSDYTAGWPDLESVPRELDRVERTLAAQGFHVVKVLDPNAEQLERAFKDFIDDYGYQRGNRLLFFFSGHGHTWEEEGHGYLVPSDAPRPRIATGDPGQEFLRKALFMSDILAWSRQMTANHALFLFDSCFSGAVFKQKALPGQPPHISRAMARPVREFITAGSAGETVPARSVFTPAFVDALEHAEGDLNGDGYVTGMELGLHLEAMVPRHARQSPQFGKHPEYRLSRGDFVFALGQSGTKSPPPLPESAAEVEIPPREPHADPKTGEQALALTSSQRRQVQSALNALGFDAGPADGVFGLLTRGAISNYQRNAGLASTGYLTAEQLARLDAEGREREAPSGASVEPGKTWIEPVTGMELVWVPEGCFEMGSEDGDPDERPVHRVCVQGFWLGKHEVTQGQWRRVMGDNPAYFKEGDDHPVKGVSWKDAQDFITRLNREGQGGLLLPSEAQWEYACRSGGRTETYCGGEDVDRLGWHGKNSGGTTHPVGRKQANGWGLHDMSGNVWEWVRDCYRDSHQGAPSDGSAREQAECAWRVLRGGGWGSKPGRLRSADRDSKAAVEADYYVGIRLARTP